MSSSAFTPHHELLRITDLHAFYGESHVLHGIDLSVENGEVVTLLGRNGSGRTTTLKAILGLVRRAHGLGHDERARDDRPAAASHRAPRASGTAPRSGASSPASRRRRTCTCSRPWSSAGMTVEEIYAPLPEPPRAPHEPGDAALRRRAADARPGPDPARRGAAPAPRRDHRGARARDRGRRSAGAVRTLKERGFTMILVEQNFRFVAPLADRHYLSSTARIVDVIPKDLARGPHGDRCTDSSASEAHSIRKEEPCHERTRTLALARRPARLAASLAGSAAGPDLRRRREDRRPDRHDRRLLGPRRARARSPPPRWRWRTSAARCSGKPIVRHQRRPPEQGRRRLDHRPPVVRRAAGGRDRGPRLVLHRAGRHAGRRGEEADHPPLRPRLDADRRRQVHRRTTSTTRTTPTRWRRAPAARSSSRAARPGSSSPPTTSSASRWRRTPSKVVEGCRRQGAGRASRPPSRTTDFSSYLLQAQASGAQIIGLANAGADTINAIKQANEFGLTKKQSLAGLARLPLRHPQPRARDRARACT